MNKTVVVRGGRERVVRNPQTCWFTGGHITNFNKSNGDDRWTREHLVPQSSALYATLTPAQHQKNVVTAFAYVNSLVGSLSLSLKYEARDRIRMELYGTTNLADVPLEQRVRWSKDLKKLVTRLFAEVTAEYKPRDKNDKVTAWIWQNPTVVPTSGTRLWSLENPYHTMTQELLDYRVTALNRLREAALERMVKHFKDYEADAASFDAITADLRMADL